MSFNYDVKGNMSKSQCKKGNLCKMTLYVHYYTMLGLNPVTRNYVNNWKL